MTKIIFDNKALNWDDSELYRDTFLAAMKQKIKDLVKYRGWATLADVADILGITPYTYEDFIEYGKVVFAYDSEVDNIMKHIEIRK